MPSARRLALALLLPIAIAACAPSESTIATAISLTRAAEPTTPVPTLTPEPTALPTATLIPLSAIDIEGALIADGDFPQGVVAGQVRSTPPGDLTGLPDAAQLISRSITYDAFTADGITVALYEANDSLESAWTVAQQTVLKTVPGIASTVGERSIISSELAAATQLFPSALHATKLAFVRCRAVVYVSIFAPNADIEMVTAYAVRLDRRLTELVCR